MKTRILTAAAILLGICLLALFQQFGSKAQPPGTIIHVSVASEGIQGNDASWFPSISADGRFVAFTSWANNLVNGDTNNDADIFVHNRQTGETTRISTASDGTEGNKGSWYPSISADGRYVAFISDASNLVSSDTNERTDVFVHDCLTGGTIRVSVDSNGVQGNRNSGNPLISDNGRYVAFESGSNNLVNGDTNGYGDIFVHDLHTSQTSRISVASDGTEANSGAATPSISGLGQYVAFYSSSNNLISDDTNGYVDVFVHDRESKETSRVSVSSSGMEANGDSGGYNAQLSISTDGQYVAFQSSASNLVSDDTNNETDIFIHNRQTNETLRVSIASDGTQANSWSGIPSISADGHYVAFVSSANNLVGGDTNEKYDVFVHDLVMGQTELISITLNGTQGRGTSTWASISANGRYVSFFSNTVDLVNCDTNGEYDIFVRDRELGKTTRVSVTTYKPANDGAYWPSISGNGRYIAFDSRSCNLMDSDTNGKYDVFVYDQATSQTTCVSVASDGTLGNRDSFSPSISADGRYVAFSSESGNLVPNDTNGERDVFIHDRQTGQTTRVSIASDGTQGNEDSGIPSISADGRYVAFQSDASNLVKDDNNFYCKWPYAPNCTDIFVHDRITGQTTRVSVSSVGEEGNSISEWPSISDDGRFVAFQSIASNLVSGDINEAGDTFVHDRLTGQTVRVSVDSTGIQGNGNSGYYGPSISADGRYVAFLSDASNLVPGDTNPPECVSVIGVPSCPDIFVHDLETGDTTRVSLATDGTEGNGCSGCWSPPSISADGRYVAFDSEASNLISNDNNEVGDVFIHDRVTNQTHRISVSTDGVEGNSDSEWPSITIDGRYAAFYTYASNLLGDGVDSGDQILVHDRYGGLPPWPTPTPTHTPTPTTTPTATATPTETPTGVSLYLPSILR